MSVGAPSKFITSDLPVNSNSSSATLYSLKLPRSTCDGRHWVHLSLALRVALAIPLQHPYHRHVVTLYAHVHRLRMNRAYMSCKRPFVVCFRAWQARYKAEACLLPSACE